MKILMLNFDKIYKGTFYRSYNWAKHLVHSGHEVTIVCIPETGLYRSKIHFEHGIRILQTPTFMNGTLLMTRLSGTPGWCLADVMHRFREIINGNYDIVQIFEHFPNVSVPIYLAPKKKVPVLVSDWCDHFGKGGFREEYCSPYKLNFLYKRIGYPLRLLMDFVEKDIRIRAAGVTVISKFLQERALSAGVNRQNIYLIPGSVDTDTIKPLSLLGARQYIGLSDKKQVITFLGGAQFDLDLALDAFQIVVRSNPDTYFLVIGKKETFVEQKAFKLEISRNVIQTGWCSDDSLPFYLAASDVFLLPMKDNYVNRARWPNKIGEYMATGRPTICTRVGDVAKIIRDEEIGLVAEPDRDDFAKKILYLLGNAELRRQMGSKARQVAETKFSLQVQGAQIEELYGALLQRHRYNTMYK